MKNAPDNLNELLARAERGELDEFTSEQIDMLEAHLNESSDAADRLLGVAPPIEPRLSAAVQTPNAAAWDAMFDRIEAGEASTKTDTHKRDLAAGARESAVAAGPRTGRASRRLIRIWETVTAAAACITLVLGWQFFQPASQDDWPLELATDVQIEDMTVYGDASTLVSHADSGSPTVIWVFDDDNGG